MKVRLVFCGTRTLELIDTGSTLTCISEPFYDSLDPKPELLDTKDFGLSIVSANGSQLPYKGYIEADILTPSFEGIALSIPCPCCFKNKIQLSCTCYYWNKCYLSFKAV